MNISQILTNGKLDNIENVLYESISKMADYCDDILGEGFFGKVTSPQYGPVSIVKIDTELIFLKTAIKEEKHKGNITTIGENQKVYIIGNTTLAVEALLMCLMSKLWYESITPHVPFLIGLSMCKAKTGNLSDISRIIFERHGLTNENNLPRSILIQKGKKFKPYICNANKDIVTSLATLDELFMFIDYFTDENLMCELPNKIKVYIPELIDFLTVSFIHTSMLLKQKYKIYLSDQHAGNILIHWINDMSRIGKKNIANLEEIYYQIDKNKYLKFKTPKILLKISDIGTCVAEPQENLIIIGDMMQNKDGVYDFELLDLYKEHPTYFEMFTNLTTGISRKILNETVIGKIMSDDLYNNVSIWGIPIDKPLPSEFDILNKFEKYIVTKTNDSNTTFIVNI
jgi:hypothetical protein